MRKTTIITTFLCFIFNYSMIFSASAIEDGIIESDFLPHEQEMKQILDSAFTAYLRDVYETSPEKSLSRSKKAPASRSGFGRDALFNFLTHMRRMPDSGGLFRFSQTLSQSCLTPEIIAQILQCIFKHPQIFSQIPSFTLPKDSKDQKNLSMGALIRSGKVIIPHDHKIFESGAESRLFRDSAREVIAHMSLVDPLSLGLGIYSHGSGDCLESLNQYLTKFWDIRFLNPDEEHFLSFPNSRFSTTILASNNMFGQIQTIVDFSPKEAVSALKISPEGPFYDVLKRLKETNLTTINNKTIKVILKQIYDLLATVKGTRSLYNTILKNPDQIEDYIKFDAPETDVIIYGGYLYNIFKKIQDNRETLSPKTAQKSISLFATDFQTSQTFIENTVKAFDNQIFSRFCSEQKVLFDIYRAFLRMKKEGGIDQEISPYILIIDTYKYPCPACRMSFPRAISIFEKEFDIGMRLKINYHADYDVNPGEEGLDEMTTRYANDNGVTFHKFGFCSPCLERTPLKTGTPNSTPPTKVLGRPDGSSTAGGRLEKHSHRTKDDVGDPLNHLVASCQNDGYNSGDDELEEGEH